ncbi:MAG: hypothetical protein M0D57_00110 [Sphingobacteriales bacterium JAD_PAG50586_3]|nr:MAG: hypothetical protein M0D57_00110 [Sphingobacteriales bacterium JAD_PAG50586_3]
MYNYTQLSKAIIVFATLLFSLTLNAQTPVDTTKKSTGSDTIYQNVQLSFLPFIGTNGTYAGKTINRVSINVLAGHSLGTNGFEVGAIANTNKGNMRGFQAAGFANIVGGNVKGFQAAGFTNIVGGKVDGFQSAGFVNVTKGSVKGFQAAGFANVNGGTTDGFMAAGFVNVNSGNTQGFQASGFINVLGDTTTGAAVAGYINVAKYHKAGLMAAGAINYAHYKNNGLQLAGLINYADTISRTAQIAGLINFTRKGSAKTQIAGLINYSKDVKGLQLAPFNFSDTVSTGVPIGFFTFVRTGVHQLELSGDELGYLNLAFRTGTRQFHNIFTAGMVPVPSDSVKWTFGYGIGTSARLSNRVNLDFDLTSNQMSHGKYFNNLNMLNKLYIGVEYAITKKVKVAAGPVLNVFWLIPKPMLTTAISKPLHPTPYTTISLITACT